MQEKNCVDGSGGWPMSGTPIAATALSLSECRSAAC